VITILVEGIITFIIVASLLMVAPGVLYSVQSAAPYVPQTSIFNATQVQIGTVSAGGLNLSAISLIMLGIGLMIGGFMLVRGYR
jgi:hypothetical protein